MSNYSIPNEYTRVPYVYSGGIGVVDLGTLSWHRWLGSFNTTISGCMYTNTGIIVLSGKFTPYGYQGDSSTPPTGLYSIFHTGGEVCVSYENTITAQEFKQLVSGTMAYYTLATPTTAATRIGLIEGAGPSPHTYIPVKRLSDGFYGLYCPEDGTFTDNLGGAYFGGHDDLFARKRLPDEYWEVEYLESTEGGGQYIDTGIKPTPTTITDLMFVPLQIEVGDGFFGGRDNPNNRYQCYDGSIGIGTGFWIWGELTRINTTISGSGSLTVNGKDRVATSGVLSTITAMNISLPIFALNDGGTMHYGKARVEYCRLYDDSTLILNFLPALRKSDLKPGMYDLVEGKFYTNQGAGADFLYGAIVPYPQDISLGGKGVACIKGPRLPQEYQQVEYLESHGTEYLSMGSVESSDIALDIRVRFAPTRLVGRYNGSYDGVLGDNGQPQLGWYATGWTCGYAESQQPYPPVVGTVYEYRYTGGDGKYYIDSQDTGLVRTGTVNTSLFRCESYPRYAHIYSAVVKSSTINYHMLPARRKSDGKPGMYDLVGRQFYTNQGTGEFTCGPDCGSYVDGRLIDYPEGQTIWAKPAVLTNASGEILRDIDGEILTTADDDIV